MKRLTKSLLALGLVCSFLSIPAGAAASHPFSDVPEDHWAWQGVQYVYENGIMKGTSEDTFSPDTPFSRAMFVTILGRAEGVDPLDYPGPPFVDVAGARWDWAAPYIQWASKLGIVNGVGGGRFAPNNTITREQYCTILIRYMDAVGLDFVGSPLLAPGFEDVYEIQSYALPSVMRLAGYGLMDSYGGFVYPSLEMNRGDIANLFARFHQMVSTGSVPPVYSTRTDPYIGYNEVADLLVETSIFTWDWFYGGTYLDWQDQISGYDPLSGEEVFFGRVVYPDVYSQADVEQLGRMHYTDETCWMLTASQQWQEAPNGLYQSLYSNAVEPYEGMDSCALDIHPLGEEMFSVSLILYAGQEEIARIETLCIYQDGYWVFADPIPIMLDVVPLAFG